MNGNTKQNVKVKVDSSLAGCKATKRWHIYPKGGYTWRKGSASEQKFASPNSTDKSWWVEADCEPCASKEQECTKVAVTERCSSTLEVRLIQSH